MKLSIVIPAYNEQKNIDECLACVEREIQGSSDIEVIVVNNASTDSTRERVLAHPGVHLVDEPQKGIVHARAAGYAKSSGMLIANIDADSRMPKGWITRVRHEFMDESLMALSGPYIYYDAPFHIRFFTRIFYIVGYTLNVFNRYVFGNASMLQGGNYVLRRTALEKIGGYDTSIEFYGEDSDIGRRVSQIGKVKWTFSFPMETSGRRLMKEGLIRSGWVYAVNHLSVTFRKKPATQTYTDVRL
jgi:cellulose synthase/poly-beta-1,6-N-acetylglucosamine synthase-like glycosyltransferase